MEHRAATLQGQEQGNGEPSANEAAQATPQASTNSSSEEPFGPPTQVFLNAGLECPHGNLDPRKAENMRYITQVS